MKKLSKICTLVLCLMTSGTWFSQAAYGQVTLINLMPASIGVTSDPIAPSGSARAMRAVTIVRATEATSFFGAAATIKAFGFNLRATTLPNAVTGTVNIYMLNTTDLNYVKGGLWTAAISDMTQVCTNCAFTIPAAGATSYDIPLTTNFAYTGGGIYVAYDFTITSPLIAPSLVTYLATNLPTGANANMALYQGVAPAKDTLSGTGLRPQMRFTVDNPFANDNVVTGIIAPGKMPVGSPSAFNQIKSTVLNRGFNSVTNLAVTLTVSGPNAFSNTKVIPFIAAGQGATVTFDAFVPTIVGANTVLVSVPADNNLNPANNRLSIALQTTCGAFSYANNAAQLANSGIGFGMGAGLILNKFKTSASNSVIITSLNMTIANDTATRGKIINGVIVDTTGKVLATSPNYTILAADRGTVKLFTFPTPIIIPAGNAFMAGMTQTASTTSSYRPLASQTIVSPAGFGPVQTNIVPVDTDVLFSGSLPAADSLTNLSLINTLNIRLMVDVNTTNIKFSDSTARNGKVDSLFSLNAAATSTSGALTYSVTTALPAGLSINPTTGLISGMPTVATASANYTVRASSPGACIATKTYTFAIFASTSTNNALSIMMKVYPNPSTNDFNVDFGGLNMNKATVRVYDALGKKVFASEVKSNLMTISLDNLATGIYLMEVETPQGRILKKLAKQ